MQCELSNWVDVLDKLDDVLDRCCDSDSSWMLACDMPGHESYKHLLLTVLQFTALLVEQSFSRHLYSSMDHLTALLSSSDMTVVLAVLDVLYMFRSIMLLLCKMSVISHHSFIFSRITPRKSGLLDTVDGDYGLLTLLAYKLTTVPPIPKVIIEH